MASRAKEELAFTICAVVIGSATAGGDGDGDSLVAAIDDEQVGEEEETEATFDEIDEGVAAAMAAGLEGTESTIGVALGGCATARR